MASSPEHAPELSRTPADLGYRMPAEWEPHAGTLLSWPRNRETWPGERLGRVEQVYARIIQEITKRERLHLIVHDDDGRTLKRVRAALEPANPDWKRITLHHIPSNDVWARDFGPIFVRRGAADYAITNWAFNAWGGKYPPFGDDNRVPAYFGGRFGLPVFSPPVVLEGGSIETNGAGTLLTTESVLLKKNRNPHLSKAEIEEYLKAYLGQERIIWLKNGLAGDDTDGHIDDLSRFLNERCILTMRCNDPDDINYEALEENYARLKAATDAQGRPFEVLSLPMPQTRIEGTTVDGSEHVPASYANFYFINGAVLLPVYDARYDAVAITLFEQQFPERDIIPVPCADLVWGQGSIHCISQQLYGPAAEKQGE